MGCEECRRALTSGRGTKGPLIQGPFDLSPSRSITDADRMFVRYFVEIEMPFEHLEAALLDHPESWIPGLARKAGEDGEQLLVEVGFEPSGRRVEREVEISFGGPMRFPSQTVLPMSWKPTTGGRLLPALEADLEMAPLTPTRSHLSVSARYRPPLGGIGRALDRALLHRVAESTMKDFLDRVATELEQLPSLAG